MIDRLRELLKLDAKNEVDFGTDEKLIMEIRRHWIVLLGRLVVPVLLLGFFGGLALYRALGGTFLVVDSGAPVGLDLLNWLLVALTVGIILIWFALFVRGKKTAGTRYVLVGVGIALVLLIWYRFNGGRVFYIDAVAYSDQQTDPFNIFLIISAGISAIAVLFTFYDWLNDGLILTNQRVIYDNDQVIIPRLLEQRVQEQIFLVEVQGVSAKTTSYLQHYLNYGTITVRSARFGGNIEFASAAGAKEMQKAINDQMKAAQKSMTTAEYDRLIEDRVYGNKAPKNKFAIKIRQTRGTGLLNWLLIENPEFNEDDGTYTWRAHWLFLLRELIWPVGALMVALVLLTAASNGFTLEPGATVLAGLAILVVFGAWAAWEYEDYRNDLYIVSPTTVTDIDKKPWGPENRLTAQVAQLTNVRYETDFFGNLVGYGDVFLETPGSGQKFTFYHVPRPKDVVNVINEYFAGIKLRENVRIMENTADLLNRYHEAQQRHNELNSPPASMD